MISCSAGAPGEIAGKRPQQQRAWGETGGRCLQGVKVGACCYSWASVLDSVCHFIPLFFWAFHQTIMIRVVIWCLRVTGGMGHWQHPQSSWSESTHGEERVGSQTLRFPAGLGWAATVSEQHKRRGQRREQLPSCTSLWAGRLLASPFG